MNNKICIIAVYFGELPDSFPLWMMSARENAGIDFLVFTDQELQNDGNIRFIRMALSDIRERASRITGFEAVLDKPYKCCDYKPLYGLIFADYIAGYDYWGHCDLDLIFGDLKGFFDRYSLYDYDRFLALGHLSMYRNTDEVNKRFKLPGAEHGYEQVFSSNQSFAFDELDGMTRLYHENGFPIFEKNIFADITSVHKRFRLIEAYPLDTRPVNYKEQIFCWRDGRVFRLYWENGALNAQEYIYIHFKKRKQLKMSPDICRETGFYITSGGFYPMDREPSRESIRRLEPYPGRVHEKCEEARFAVGRAWAAVKRRAFKNNKCRE